MLDILIGLAFGLLVMAPVLLLGYIFVKREQKRRLPFPYDPATQAMVEQAKSNGRLGAIGLVLFLFVYSPFAFLALGAIYLLVTALF